MNKDVTEGGHFPLYAPRQGVNGMEQCKHGAPLLPQGKVYLGVAFCQVHDLAVFKTLNGFVELSTICENKYAYLEIMCLDLKVSVYIFTTIA